MVPPKHTPAMEVHLPIPMELPPVSPGWHDQALCAKTLGVLISRGQGNASCALDLQLKIIPHIPSWVEGWEGKENLFYSATCPAQ